MVKVACEKCGKRSLLDDAEVPPTGKAIRCESCGHTFTAKPGPKPPGGATPPPIPSDALGAQDLADLPAPARSGPLSGARGGPKPLPGNPLDDADLPAPVSPQGDADLPAPVSPSDDADLPAPVSPRGDADLPAPVSRGDDADLPAPVSPRGDADLPAPASGASDLPQPLGPAGNAHLSGPTGGGAGADGLPAPKGFFDDAVAPAGQGSGKSDFDLPAPKGFFDDIPGPAGQGGGKSDFDLPAPKGFFDDIPGPAGQGGGGAPAPSDAGGGGGAGEAEPLELGEPLSLDEPGAGGGEAEPLELGEPLSLDDPGAAAEPLDLGEPMAAGGDARPFGLDALELDEPGGQEGGSAPAVPLELDEPAGQGGGASPFGEVDLPDAPAGGGGGVVTFQKPSGPPPAAPSSQRPQSAQAPQGAPGGHTPFGLPSETSADLELDTSAAPGMEPVRSTVAGRERRGEDRKARAAAEAAGRKKKRRLVALSALAALLLGGGGFYGFTRWQESKNVQNRLDRGLARAEKQLRADTPGHWGQAEAAAQSVLEIDEEHPAALGMVAEANYAALLDRGTDRKKRERKGSKALERARDAAAASPHVEKGEALQSIVERRPKEAIERLQKLLKKDAQDVNAKLYLGWAYASAHDDQNATKMFQRVLEQDPEHLAARYGLARAQLRLGMEKEARASFRAVADQSREERDRDHIGALVGLAQLAEVERFGDREDRYREILDRERDEQQDPRAFSRAWSLAGHEALESGRLDRARQDFSKALDLDPQNLSAYIGEGKAALRQDDLEVARERLSRVLSLDPTNLEGTLAMAETELASGHRDEAEKLVSSLLEREPPVERKAVLARAHMIRGDLYEASPDGAADAEEAYRQAIELAPEGDIAPTLALSRLYVKQGRGEDALELLEPIKQKAEEDANTAISLGVAFLESGDAEAAEEVLRTALRLRPDNLEAAFQLGVALFEQERYDEAVKTLEDAYESDEAREDVGLRLARMYEELDRTEDAEELYAKLLSGPSPSIGARAAAGRFYVSQGDEEALREAISLGESIRKEEPRHPAGLYLQGEALFAEENFQEARARFLDAVRLDSQPQYLEALARASEELELFDDGLAYYEKAAEEDETYLAPRLGLARIRIARREYRKALEVLGAARELGESPAVYRAIGRCHLEMNAFRKATGPLEKAVALDQKAAESHYLLGHAYFDLDRARDATGALRRATDLATGDEAWITKAYWMLGYAARSTGKRAVAIRAWASYLERAEDGPERNDVERLLMRLKAR